MKKKTNVLELLLLLILISTISKKKIKFIAALLNIRINIEDYYKLLDELEANKALIIISNNINPVCLTFNEIAEY